MKDEFRIYCTKVIRFETVSKQDMKIQIITNCEIICVCVGFGVIRSVSFTSLCDVCICDVILCDVM